MFTYHNASNLSHQQQARTKSQDPNARSSPRAKVTNITQTARGNNALPFDQVEHSQRCVHTKVPKTTHSLIYIALPFPFVLSGLMLCLYVCVHVRVRVHLAQLATWTRTSSLVMHTL